MDPSLAEKKELFLADLAGLSPILWPPVSPGWGLPGAGRHLGSEWEGRFRELRGKSAGRSPCWSPPLLSLGLRDEDVHVLYFLYSVIFRADLHPTCGQGLWREQRTGGKGLERKPGVGVQPQDGAPGLNPDLVTSWCCKLSSSVCTMGLIRIPASGVV